MGAPCIDDDRVRLRGVWSETSWRMQRLRDDPDCADEEQAARLDETDPGLSWQLGFDPDDDIAAPMIATGVAAARRDPARAGRQQPGRDGGGIRPRRV